MIEGDTTVVPVETPRHSRFAGVALALGIIALPLYPVLVVGWFFFAYAGIGGSPSDNWHEGARATMQKGFVACIILNLAGGLLALLGRMQKNRKHGLSIAAMWLNALPLLVVLVVVGCAIYVR
jgi:hypothetical protein